MSADLSSGEAGYVRRALGTCMLVMGGNVYSAREKDAGCAAHLGDKYVTCPVSVRSDMESIYFLVRID